MIVSQFSLPVISWRPGSCFCKAYQQREVEVSMKVQIIILMYMSLAAWFIMHIMRYFVCLFLFIFLFFIFFIFTAIHYYRQAIQLVPDIEFQISDFTPATTSGQFCFLYFIANLIANLQLIITVENKIYWPLAGLSLRAVTRNTCHGWAQWLLRVLQVTIVHCTLSVLANCYRCTYTGYGWLKT